MKGVVAGWGAAAVALVVAQAVLAVEAWLLLEEQAVLAAAGQ